MSKTTWLDGPERIRTLRHYAQRLWDARDRVKATGGSIAFDGCVYVDADSEPNEFSTGTSRLEADGVTFMMAWGVDPMTQALDAVNAWRMIEYVTGRMPEPPAVVHVPEGPPVEKRRLGLSALFLGSRIVTRQPAYDIVDPMQLARHELGRLLHEAVVAEGAHPRFGLLTMTVARGIELWNDRPMRAVHRRIGSTHVHPFWREPIARAIARAQEADPRWMADKARFEERPRSDEACWGEGYM